MAYNIDQAAPADDDIVSQFPANERTNRTTIEAWLTVDHDTDGFHKQVSMPNQLADPSFASGTGGMWTKDGSIKSRVGSGAIKIFDAFASGTKIVFSQATAPTGWTQDTSINDRVIRIVSTAGGGTGGSWTISNLSVDDHTLTVAELPAHHHDTKFQVSAFGIGSGSSAFGVIDGARQSADTGSGTGHSHGLTSGGLWRPSYTDMIVASKD